MTNLAWSEGGDWVSRLSRWQANGEPTRRVWETVRVVLERQAPALKRAMSTRPFSLAIEVSIMNFDHLRRGPNGPKGQRSCVRKMTGQRVRLRSEGDRGWVRTALARTSALAIVTADQHTPYEMEGQNAPKPGMGRACISVRRWCQHNFMVGQCESFMQRQEGG